MLQPRLLTPFRVFERAIAPSLRSAQNLYQSRPLLPRALPTPSKPTPSFSLLPFAQVRHASHATQGAANRHSRDPAGKRLGAKRTGGEYVVPGCIIFRQRGTKWFPGENCGMGRDHTIYATHAGYVQYYLDPERHPDRRYIGVCFEKEGKLPNPRNAPTKRKLNMVAIPRVVEENTTVAVVGEEEAATGPQMRPGYMFREANWVIGRAAEEAGVTAKPFDRTNRWLAWRKRQARVKRSAQMKSFKNNSKKGGKKSGGGR
ncbi:hypothetical protein ASPZODRAFT_130487 [Penicilliopsis zonata CBS 506.65]|uniref:Large ribosomal subunit protein bL27m n=1 Tax=Penicilliopsis zonata CBS 506.65 TaxID=1073090 RepID=A0A1L9SMM6_9EURO|nr:hypothetical protein ASPZODRAFT_130487 [Penicilliopsis zonata CBS 506.65]OJJ48460.1 hypothetical protein ASPZODRAFT_130487 [Penicilliopsis zonata CBS 506.65]